MPFDNRMTNAPTPQRVYALCKLVREKKLSKEELQQFLQPRSIVDKAQQFTEVFNLARKGNLISENPDGKYDITLSGNEMESINAFRYAIAKRTFSNNQFIFTTFSTWYIMKNEKVFRQTSKQLEVLFNEETNSSADGLNRYNDTNINGWRTWAAFLGLGYIHKNILIPNAMVRIQDAIAHSADLKRDVAIPFSRFMDWLNQTCPELDGGDIFRSMRQYHSLDSQQLSLGLSSGLRALHDTRIIHLSYQPDARETWFLTQSLSHPVVDKVSSIVIKGRE